jgi:hypothetical protein
LPAILTDECVDLPPLEREIDPMEDFARGEALADMPHGQEGTRTSRQWRRPHGVDHVRDRFRACPLVGVSGQPPQAAGYWETFSLVTIGRSR